MIELYGINTSFEDAEDAEADQTIYYWLDGLGLGRRQARAEVSRWLYFQNSRSNYFVEIEEADCCCKIDYRRKKPTVIARLTTEAEYLACSEATREAHGLIYLHRDVTGETMVPLIHCDSNGALSTIRSTITSDKAKHIEAYCAHSIGLRLRYSRAHGIGLRSRAHGIGLRSHAHGIGSSRSCLDKRFLHLRGSDIHAETKV